ncbi:MAG: efflux RND transporter permease subunit [Myxococcales bacterium]|nr:efflux RND transporter permease subunit [Myxococcales bacterium]
MLTLLVALWAPLALASPADWLAKLRPTPVPTTPPPLTVQVICPGYSPAAVEAQVARPVEGAVTRLPGLAKLSSTAREGVLELALTFEAQVPPGRAAQRTREALDAARATLPDDCEPALLRRQPGTILRRYALPGGDPAARARAARIAEGLERFAGITEVRACGLPDPHLKVEADARRLAAFGLTLEAVAAALAPTPGADVQALSAVMLTPKVRLSDVATLRLEDTPRCHCEVDGAAAVCLTVLGHGGAPLKLDEAAADARLLPTQASDVHVHLAEADRWSAVFAAARRAVPGATLHLEADGPTIRARVPASQRPALEAALRALPGVQLAHSRDPGEPVTEIWLGGPADALPPLLEATRAALSAARIGRAVEDPAPPVPAELQVRLSSHGRRMGITPHALAQAVRAGLEGVPAGRPGATPITVIQSPRPELTDLTVATPGGARVPLSAVATIERLAGPQPVQRRDGRPGHALWVVGATPAQVEPALQALSLPAGVTVTLQPRP